MVMGSSWVHARPIFAAARWAATGAAMGIEPAADEFKHGRIWPLLSFQQEEPQKAQWRHCESDALERNEEIDVTETSFYLAFSTFNLLLLLLTSIILSNLYAKARQLTQSTRTLTELAEQMARIDRRSASEVALIAREISSDIGRLRQLDLMEGNA